MRIAWLCLWFATLHGPMAHWDGTARSISSAKRLPSSVRNMPARMAPTRPDCLRRLVSVLAAPSPMRRPSHSVWRLVYVWQDIMQMALNMWGAPNVSALLEPLLDTISYNTLTGRRTCRVLIICI